MIKKSEPQANGSARQRLVHSNLIMQYRGGVHANKETENMSIARAECICKTCGKHFERSTTKRNIREAESWVKWAESAFDECLECQNERLLQEAITAEHEFGMCKLKGTEKQIAWARRIRAENYLNYTAQKKQGKWNEVEIATLDEMFKEEARSWFWIEQRDASMRTRGSRYWKDKKEKEGQA